ncbi:MAG TPA: hypothetical protein VGD78_19510 [Chthoniobacterales bacterium]
MGLDPFGALMVGGSQHQVAFEVFKRFFNPGLRQVELPQLGRLWQESGLPEAVRALLKGSRYAFDVERAFSFTVLYRLFASGSDRAAEHWREHYPIPGAETLELYQLYWAMAFLGEEASSPADPPGGPPRCQKDHLEGWLFARRRDLFTEVDLVFFDTTSLYFESEGGQTLGERGFNKDHRPDLRQMVVGLAVDVPGRPVCCELWPGNTADVMTLQPVAERMRQRFWLREVTVVADRGMVGQATRRRGHPAHLARAVLIAPEPENVVPQPCCRFVRTSTPTSQFFKL